MFIRCTRPRSPIFGEPYVTYRLVQTARVGGAVKQTTLLNLGSHLRERQFDPALACRVQSAGNVTIKIQPVLDAQGHALLYCHSPAREQKDRAINAAKTAGFEAVLVKLQAGLELARGAKDVATIMQRLGRARQRYARAAQHYWVEVAKDATGTLASAITWTQRVKPGSAAKPWKTDPGVYCLRTTLVEQDNATLWRTFSMLTNLESVLRSLMTDLGLRPVCHQIDRRVEGHLFIRVLAYHFVPTLRLQLKAQGHDDSGRRCARRLPTQQRVTATLQRRDGRAVQVRKATRPEPRQQKINRVLGLAPNPGGTHRVLVQRDLSARRGDAPGSTKVVPYAPNYVSNSLI